MKISILTHPPAKNYGGIMQALALSAILQEMGHDCTIIRGPIKKQSFFKRIKKIVLTLIGKDKEIPFKHLTDFVQKHLPVSPPWYGGPLTETDCFVVGSDQVWRPEYTHWPGAYFLDFLPAGSTAEKIAYAASFGVDTWKFTPEQTKTFSELLRRFDAVSVRENSGVSLCRNHLQCDAVQMPDPTLLHTADFYRSFVPEEIKKQNFSDKHILFTYFLDQNSAKNTLANSFSAKANLHRDDFLPSDKKSVRRPVEEFINGIAHADFVLTDSFHGMVFSMIFGVPFAVIGNEKRGMTRFELAIKAGIPETIMSETVDAEALLALYSSPSRYKQLEQFLQTERLRGRAFLAEYIQ